jgi:hypothetical protein
MTKILNVRDANTGNIVPVDLDSPSGTLYVNDDNTGGLVPIILGGGGSVPIGSIVYAPSNPDPAKYLEMDGSWVSRASWPLLSAIKPFHDPYAPWTLSAGTGLPTSGASYREGVWNGTRYLLLRDSSNLCYLSTDGLNWSTGTMPASSTWASVAWNGSIYCAIVGTNSSNVAATSSTGATWDAQTLPASTTWTQIIWNGSVFCALGQAAVATSSNGINWSLGSLPTTNTPLWNSIGWNGSIFVALGLSSSSTMVCAATSTDGLTWTNFSEPVAVVPPSLSMKTKIWWTGSNFTTLGPVCSFYSSDGLTWKFIITGEQVTSIGYNAFDPIGGFHCTSLTNSRTFLMSRDGKVWSRHPTNFLGGGLTALIYGDGRFVIPTTAGTVLTSAYSTTQMYIPPYIDFMTRGDFGTKGYLRAA